MPCKVQGRHSDNAFYTYHVRSPKVCMTRLMLGFTGGLNLHIGYLWNLGNVRSQEESLSDTRPIHRP